MIKCIFSKKMNSVLKDPIRLLVLSFLVKIIFGVVLLSLPGMTTRPVSLLDLAFISTSGVCVTGLSTVDISIVLTSLGQWALIFLIQIGGIGIMTLWLFVLSAKGPIVGQAQVFASTAVRQKSVKGISSILYSVIFATFFFEFFGSLILFFQIFPTRGFFSSVHWAVFHSVSAFCNAGFSLQSNSMMDYQNNIWVNGVFSVLIVAGGIGYSVFSELSSFPKKISLHTCLVLKTTGFLLVLGTVLFLFLEWNSPGFSSGGFGSKLLKSMFLSVTSRTAGFNTVDTGILTDASLAILILFMLVGASPGGTGGGFKTTALAISFLKFRSLSSGRANTRFQKWEIPDSLVFRAVWIILIYLMVAMVLVVCLLFTEKGMAPSLNPHGAMGIVFEMISALGTVGLSTGITPYLSSLGKILLMTAMFLGRVGPLTFIISVGGKPKKSPIRLVEEDVGFG